MPSPPSPATPEPTTAWLLRAGEETAISGLMSIERGDLVMRDEGAEKARIALRRLHGARRTRGSPVIVLHHEEGVLLLYFVEPPALSVRTEPRRLDRLRRDRALARAAGLARLRGAARVLRERVRVWEGAIRAQAGSTATNFRPREE